MNARVATMALAVLVLATPPVPAAPPAPSSLEPAARAAAALPRLHSLLVSWRGDLLLESYFHGATASKPANIKSASKSIISTLLGIALDRRILSSIDQPIGRFFPELASTEPDKRAITLQQLISMQAGLEGTSNRNYGAWVRSRNWVRFALGRPLVDPPGTRMEYSTGNSHLLSAILTRATGVSTWQFAQDALAKPLGFSLARWPRDPQGIYFGGNDMLMMPRQMLAYGELYRNRGRAGGRQVVSEGWIEESFRVRTHSRFNGQGYGYGWWSREFGGYPTYFAWGYGGQYIFVIPALDLVVVTTSSPTVSEERRGHRRGIFDVLEQAIIPAIADMNTGLRPGAASGL